MPGLDIDALGWPLLVLAAAMGLAFGSFLNVVVHRLPLMLSRQWRAEALEMLDIAPPAKARFDLLLPRSRCARCNAPIRVLDNIPVASWLALRGRCRHCAAAISPRYPLVELAGAVLLLAALHRWGATPLAACHYALLMALLALALIDFDTLLLPDQITLPLLWLGMITAAAVPGGISLVDALSGAVGGYLLLWLFYWAHRLLTRREGMGYGDFKLLAALGAWLGWRAILPIVLIASTAGILYAAVGLLRGTSDRDTPIPFGTFLCLGGAATLFLPPSLQLPGGE